MADQTGTPLSDDLDGSNAPDMLDGQEGDDRLYGHEDDDMLYGDEGDDLLVGGEGDDLLDGGADDDTLWTGTGGDTIVFRNGYSDDVVMDFDPVSDTVSLSASGVESWSDVEARLGADADGTALLTLDDGSTLRFEGLKAGSISEANFLIEPAPVCLAAGTQVRTATGQSLIDELRPGDIIDTLDHGPQPILWIGQKRKFFGHVSHRHHPIRVPASAFGVGQPNRPLWLSPQHRILIADPSQKRRGGVLGKAKGFIGRKSIKADNTLPSIVYFQILLAQHSIMFAEDLAVESFWPGPMALGALTDDDRNAIETLVPGVLDDPVGAYGRLVRPCLTLRALRSLKDSDLRPPGHPGLLAVETEIT